MAVIITDSKVCINFLEERYDKENRDKEQKAYLYKEHEKLKSGIRIYYRIKRRRKLTKTIGDGNVDNILENSVEDFYTEMNNMYEVKDLEGLLEKLKNKYITKLDNKIIKYELERIADNQVRPIYRGFLKIINLPRPIYLEAIKQWQLLVKEIESLKIKFMLNYKE